MKHFQLIGVNAPVAALHHAVVRQPHLWNQERVRTSFDRSPHAQVDDILIRFQDIALHRARPEQIIDEHESIWCPAALMLPQCRPLIFDLMQRVEGERLGRVIITRLASGGVIAPHVDGGEHAAYYDRYHVTLHNLPGSKFRAGDEEVFMQTGSVWWFDNAVEHSVVNESLDDRITMIVDIRTLR
jgi:hypothetical protein